MLSMHCWSTGKIQNPFDTIVCHGITECTNLKQLIIRDKDLLQCSRCNIYYWNIILRIVLCLQSINHKNAPFSHLYSKQNNKMYITCLQLQDSVVNSLL